MAEFIFLNPTPNLMKVADYVKFSGRSVRIASNNQFPPITSANIHFFHGGTYSTARKSPNPKEVPADFCMKMKKNIFNFLYGRKIRSELAALGESFGQGNITDLCLMKTQGVYSHDIKSTQDESVTHQTLLNEYPNSFIVTGYMESLSGTEKMQMYDTDFSLREAFGNDFFVVFTKNDRIEVCAHGNRLITVGRKNTEHINALAETFPMLKQFSFKRVKELVISRNRQPWAYKVIDKRIILLNDFSYFSLSLKLPDLWYEKAGRLLCSEKLR
jgi:hypothetical protein